jgi:gamma-polyglutamate biosynthesis protein CapA
MNKWVILGGMIVASVLVYNVQAGKIGMDDIVRIMRFEEQRDEELSVMAFGDMMLGRYVRVLMDENGKDYIFEGVEELFDDADVLFANLEGPISGGGKKGGTEMNFAFNTDIAPFLKENGFDVLTIVNNHALDQGWDGRWSTINELEDYGVGWCGHPTEPDYDSVYFREKGGILYAFVCFNDVGTNLDQKAAVDLIEDVSDDVDYTIVTIHWGVEYSHFADSGMQKEPGREFVDAGADAVIGHHPHVVQGFEIYNDRPIFWSLGNFVFDQYWSVMTQEQLGVMFTFSEEKISIKLHPMKSELSKPRLLTEEEYDVWIEQFIKYSDYDEDLRDQIRSGVIEINL